MEEYNTYIESGTVLIVDFLGWDRSRLPLIKTPNLYPDPKWRQKIGWTTDHISSLQFHTSFDWLMPVLEKICRTEIGGHVRYASPRIFGTVDENTRQPMVALHGFDLFMADTLIEAAFLAIVDFLEWRYRYES